MTLIVSNQINQAGYQHGEVFNQAINVNWVAVAMFVCKTWMDVNQYEY